MSISGKFLGPTSGNKTRPINVSASGLGSGESHGGTPSGKFLGQTSGQLSTELSDGAMHSGESHGGAPSGKFLGPTPGNKNLPIDRTSGTGGGAGGKFIAGGGGK